MLEQEIDRQNGYRPGVAALLTRDGNVLLGTGVSWLTLFAFENNDWVLTPTPESWRYGWDILQGGIEPGETFRQAIVREVNEEIGTEWQLDLTQVRPFRVERLEFPVKKDGRTYRGKTYYFFTIEVLQTPDGYEDWVFGHRGDEGPYVYPTPGFPGGIMFMGHRSACDVIRRSGNGRKGALVTDVLNQLRHQRMIRA
jgi:8-oxo-dGTP pyrophosphatase MutT (NUDIX family)